MSDLDYGFAKAITAIVGGLVIGSFYVALVSWGIIPEFVLSLIKLASAGVWFVILRNISDWSLAYIFGWCLGLYIVFQAGLLGSADILLYAIVVAAGLWFRFKTPSYN
jgi:hypothetical protein